MKVINNVDIISPALGHCARAFFINAQRKDLKKWRMLADVPTDMSNRSMLFYVDRIGMKHTYDSGGLQSLSCNFDDTLIKEAGVWRVKINADLFMEARAIKKREINAGTSQALSSITSLYTREEMDSWPTQEAEAKAWNADNTAASPFIDSLVANNAGIDKASTVNKILTNALTYKTASGAVIGKKQALMDAVNALPDTSTQADLDGIVVAF